MAKKKAASKGVHRLTPKPKAKAKPTVSAKSDLSKEVRSVIAAAPVAAASSYSMVSTMRDETVRGADYLASVVIPTGTADGTVFYNMFVSPSTVPSRLGQVARLWERYQFRRLRLRFVPSVPSTTPGQLTFAYDPDSTDVTPSSYVRPTLFAFDDNVSTPIYSGCVLDVRGLDLHTLYYTGANNLTADERLELQGQFYACYTGPTLSGDLVAGSLILEYEVFFSKRCYESTVPAMIPGPTNPITTTGFDVLGYISTGILARLYEAGGTYDGGNVVMFPYGIRIPSDGLHYRFVIRLAQEAVGTTGEFVNAIWTAMLKYGPTLASTLPLAFCDGKTLKYHLETLTYESGTTEYGQLRTSMFESGATGALVDYVQFGIVVSNTSGFPAYLDVYENVSNAGQPVTQLWQYGIEVEKMFSVDFRARFNERINYLGPSTGGITTEVAKRAVLNCHMAESGYVDLGLKAKISEVVASSPTPAPRISCALPSAMRR